MVITLDRDFPQILALTLAARPSVVLIRQERLRAAEIANLALHADHDAGGCATGHTPGKAKSQDHLPRFELV